MALSAKEKRRRHREANRRWRLRNPEKQRERCRRWNTANLEKTREYARRWYWANREKRRRYQLANRAKYTAYMRKWRAERRATP